MKIIIVLVCIALVAGVVCIPSAAGNRSLQDQARERVLSFADAVDYKYKTPEKIYPFLTKEFRDQMSEEAFSEAFIKERSYPYLTPLFINYSSIEFDEGNKSGTATFSQAARLPGMTYSVPFIYEDGEYYMDVFKDFPDGNYLKKFDNLSYSLDEYFDKGTVK